MAEDGVPFNVPLVLGTEYKTVLKAIQNKHLSTDGVYTNACSELLENLTGCRKAIMTTSCTDALEMSALLADIGPGDEVIMASFNFVSAANAFVQRGAFIRFVDIDPQTMNIDVSKVEEAISSNTKVILVMHYAGVPCNMNELMSIADRRGILVIEDAAHCIGSYYEKRHLGSIGHLGALSFHDTKNIQCGEGGALLINDEKFIRRAEILKDKGTDRKDFVNGNVKKYTWIDLGSSYGMSELCASFLFSQLQKVAEVINYRVQLWNQYFALFSKIEEIKTSKFQGNGHIFYIHLQQKISREDLINSLKASGVKATSHYEPLHSSKAGQKYSHFFQEDTFTTPLSKSLIRLPLYYEMTKQDIDFVFQNFMECFLAQN